MSGEARTADFLLSTATVMVGPRDKLAELTPALHSVGLIKNVQVTSDPSFVSLTQGVENIEVSSVTTGNPSKISGEVYEFTARNMAYGAGLDASTSDYEPIVTQAALASPIVSGGVTVVLATGAVAANSLVSGDFVVITDTSVDDRLHVGKVLSISTDTLTLHSDYTMPAGMSFAVATTAVYKVRNIKVGAQLKRPYFGIKLVGVLPESGEPVTVLFPKAKITRGISLAFASDNFSNMPFEFSPVALLPTDKYYADYGGSKTWSILKR